jgi:hypothetical protein
VWASGAEHTLTIMPQLASLLSLSRKDHQTTDVTLQQRKQVHRGTGEGNRSL